MAAPKGNQYAKGNKGGGQKSKITDRHIELAYKISLLGATDKEIANILEISESGLNKWKRDHKDFREALKKGKDEADALVAEKLYHRALGYTHEEEKIFNNNGEIIRAETTKHYPPDTTAAIFWLKNRQKAQWRDKQDHEVTGKDGGPIENKWTVEVVSAETPDT